MMTILIGGEKDNRQSLLDEAIEKKEKGKDKNEKSSKDTRELKKTYKRKETKKETGDKQPEPRDKTRDTTRQETRETRLFHFSPKPSLVLRKTSFCLKCCCSVSSLHMQWLMYAVSILSFPLSSLLLSLLSSSLCSLSSHVRFFFTQSDWICLLPSIPVVPLRSDHLFRALTRVNRSGRWSDTCLLAF